MAAMNQKRQERFCLEYVIDYNATQAAIRAGYSEKTAYSQANRLLKNVEILTRVRELQQEQVQRLAVSADFVILRLIETLDRCMVATPVIIQGEPTGEYLFDSKGALRALELIGKHLGMFENKINVNGTIDTGKLDSILQQLGGSPSG